MATLSNDDLLAKVREEYGRPLHTTWQFYLDMTLNLLQPSGIDEAFVLSGVSGGARVVDLDVIIFSGAFLYELSFYEANAGVQLLQFSLGSVEHTLLEIEPKGEVGSATLVKLQCIASNGSSLTLSGTGSKLGTQVRAIALTVMQRSLIVRA